MANLWLPPDSDIALAAGGWPAPGVKPLHDIALDPRVAFVAAPEYQVQLGSNVPVSIPYPAYVPERKFPISRLGKAWWSGSTGTVEDILIYSGSASRFVRDFFTVFCVIQPNNNPSKAGIFGNFSGSSNEILFRRDSGTVQFYLKNAAGSQYGPATISDPGLVPNLFLQMVKKALTLPHLGRFRLRLILDSGISIFRNKPCPLM